MTRKWYTWIPMFGVAFIVGMVFNFKLTSSEEDIKDFDWELEHPKLERFWCIYQSVATISISLIINHL